MTGQRASAVDNPPFFPPQRYEDPAAALAQVVAIYDAGVAWLREALSTPFDGVTVAVTHFAPSLQSADPRYGLVPGTAGFCNALDDLLPSAQLWLHGHLHCPTDYRVQGERSDGTPWHCQVVTNPLGYARKGEQETFHPHCLVPV